MGKDDLNDEILIVDLESTCWIGNPPKGEISDIIEIGVAHLDRTDLTISNNWNTFVIPTRSKITTFSKELNGISEEEVRITGVPLEMAFNMLELLGGKRRTWASYGNYDRKKIENDARDLGIRYPMSPRHINVKTLFAVLFDLPREVGMAEALRIIELPLKGRHHSGKDDAFNIANILRWCIKESRANMTKHFMPDGSMKYAP